jgi:hypothetical protein
MVFLASTLLASALTRPALHLNTLTVSEIQHAIRISSPSFTAMGKTVTITADPTHFFHPVYQFWIEVPGGQYESSGGYTTNSHFTFTATEPGTFQVLAYARESNAPSSETPAQQALYEVKAQSVSITSTALTQYPVELTASQPLVRAGQTLTLSAIPTGPLSPGETMGIWDETTKTMVGHINNMNGPFNFPVALKGPQTLEAEILSPAGQAVGLSEPLTIIWGDQPVGTYQGHSDAQGQTVSLTFPSSGVANEPLTITAVPTGFTNPFVQFWILAPNGSYTASGSYSPTLTYTFTPNVPGTWQVMVYARERSAPSNETPAQSAIYEAKSNTHFVTVQSGS